MKRITLALVAALTLTACGSSAATVQGANEFAQTISKSGVVVLDVRTPGEFAEGHIANAINIDAESGNFESQIASLDKSAEYAVYCRSGRRSAIAVDAMANAGFTNLKELEGGLLAWNGPLVRP